MTRRVQDWINTYIDLLIGERSASALAGEARSDEEALMAKAARRLKFHAPEDRLQPRPEFVAGLERKLRKELAGTVPGVRGLPFWRKSWSTAMGGLAAAAAMIALFLWARTGVVAPTLPMAAPASAPAREAAAPLASPPMKAAGAPALAPAAPAPTAGRSLAAAVADAQTIFLGQVAEVSIPSGPHPPRSAGRPPASDTQVVVSVQRFLKGPLAADRVILRASPGLTFTTGERVLVMARDVNEDGVLDVLDYPRARSGLAAEAAAPADVTDAKSYQADERMSLEELIRQVESLLAARPQNVPGKPVQ